MTLTTTLAQALADNRNYKTKSVDGEAVGVSTVRKWKTAVKAMLLPAYSIAAYRHDHMGDGKAVEDCDKAEFYAKLSAVLDLIGEVNGYKLLASNCAEPIISASKRWRNIDLTVEMADARLAKSQAKKAYDEDPTDENATALENASEEVKRLEGEPNNCKPLFENQTESAFVKEVERLLGDAITEQSAKSVEQITAEREAIKAARRAKTAAKKAAKAQANAQA